MTDATRSHDATHSQGPVDSTRPASDVDNSKAQALSAGFPQVPGYSIEAKIGEGGMGAVYKAVQVKLNRVVALKMIHGGKTASTRELLRFIAEAEAVAAIDHPNVVKVHDTGDANGQLYIAMEYLPNGTLSEKLQKLSHGREPVVEPASNSAPSHRRLTPSAQLSPREVAELMVKLANAVQAAHDRQIVHRDLKPSNIMFDAHDEPRITDFGLAKRQAGELTNTNAIMGTPAYMAPEQAKGESKFVGPQADVWALGVILYESLSGKRPFTGSGDFDVIQKVIEQESASLRSISKKLPRDLDLIAKKCLAKEPADRYASARALAADLQNWRDGKPVAARPICKARRAVKWIRRNRGYTLMSFMLLLSLIVGSAVATYYSLKASGERQRREYEGKLGALFDQDEYAKAMHDSDVFRKELSIYDRLQCNIHLEDRWQSDFLMVKMLKYTDPTRKKPYYSDTLGYFIEIANASEIRSRFVDNVQYHHALSMSMHIDMLCHEHQYIANAQAEQYLRTDADYPQVVQVINDESISLGKPRYDSDRGREFVSKGLEYAIMINRTRTEALALLEGRSVHEHIALIRYRHPWYFINNIDLSIVLAYFYLDVDMPEIARAIIQTAFEESLGDFVVGLRGRGKALMALKHCALIYDKSGWYDHQWWEHYHELVLTMPFRDVGSDAK